MTKSRLPFGVWVCFFPQSSFPVAVIAFCAALLTSVGSVANPRDRAAMFFFVTTSQPSASAELVGAAGCWALLALPVGVADEVEVKSVVRMVTSAAFRPAITIAMRTTMVTRSLLPPLVRSLLPSGLGVSRLAGARGAGAGAAAGASRVSA